MKTEWVDWFLDGAVLPLYACSQSTITMNRIWGLNYGITVQVIDQGKMRFSSYRENVVEIGKAALSRFKKSKKFRKRIWREYAETTSELEKIFSSIEESNLARISDNELHGLFRRFSHWYFEMWERSIFVDGLPIAGEEILLDALNRNKGIRTSEKTRLLSELLYPSKRTFLAIEQSKRRKIAKEIPKKLKSSSFEELPKKIRAQIGGHADKWFWIESNSLKTKRLSPSYFWRLISEEIGQREKKAIKVGAKRKNAIIRQLGLPASLYTSIEIMDDFSQFQDIRKMYWIKSAGYLDFVLSEIGRRKHYSLRSLKNAFPWEVEGIMAGRKLSEKGLEERENYSLAIFDGRRPRIFTGKKARKLYNKYFGSEQIDSEQVELHGICACIGRVIGKAKIVVSAKDVWKVEVGDVLIARATDPDYVVAMKKAAAIVTDEGGITSHAAVISREMNIPCLVGTKNATKIFKDGQLVEVDANHGEIRRFPK
ncbi:MAG: PEP-utilizing enzyme [Candidatus Micrarchaeota archaeon]